MPGKRSMDHVGGDSAPSTPAKKPRHGFRGRPENLPDGPWRRKLVKTKKGLIAKAKLEKQYAKIKKQHLAELQQGAGTPHHDDGVDGGEPKSRDVHPDRPAILGAASSRRQQTRQKSAGGHDEGDEEHGAGGARETNDGSARIEDDKVPGGADGTQPRTQRPKARLPPSLVKAQQECERRRLAAAQREAERIRQQKEREAKLAERERFRRSMAKARRPGKDGRPKLGRESRLLLEKVQKSLR